MKDKGIDLLYLNAGTNMNYFTGTLWHASERMVGAILPQQGPIVYIAPVFEIGTLEQYMMIKGEVYGWQEHESPYVLFSELIKRLYPQASIIGLDESCAFFISNGLQEENKNLHFTSATVITGACRMIKSDHEIALMQCAKNITLEAHKATAKILRLGISTTEVEQFIHMAHKKLGAPKGSYFVIVLFGEASAYPHGVKEPQCLKEQDMVLIDTGCQVHGYISDITRSYVFGEPTKRQRDIWNLEKAAQEAAFNAAKLNRPCAEVDLAARKVLEDNGLGPNYTLPGLPHRTGHGIGLDIHEWPYLHSADQTPLRPGMCFSNEPMICLPGEFGVRLEDHFYMTENGPKWFTQPSHSIDKPFASN
jgi:Xaa-Pro dipeptidase